MSMLVQIKRLTKDTFSYGLSSSLQKLITFFLFPIYARLLTPTDFGIQDVIQTSVYIVTLFLVLGLDSSVMMFYYESQEEEKPKILSTYLWFEIIVSIPIVLILIFAAKPICGLILNDPKLAPYFQIGIGSVPLALVVGSMLSTLRLTFQTKKFVLMTTVGVILQISFAILFVIVFKWAVKGVLLSILVSYFFQTILGIILTKNSYIFFLSTIWLKKLLKNGLPLVPAALSFWVMSYANRFFLIEYSTLEDIGLLSIVNRVSSVLMLFLTAFSSAWGPYAYSLAINPTEAKETYGRILTYFTLFSLTAALGLSLFAREVILILATSVYEKGSTIVMATCLSSVIWSAMYIVGMGTGIAKKNHHYTISVVMGAIVNTVFNYLLIPHFGVTGAVYSTLIGNVISLIYIYNAGQQYFRVKYENYKLLFIVLLVIFATVVGIWIDYKFEVWDYLLIIYKLLIFILYFISLIVFKIITRTDILKCYNLIYDKFTS